MTDINDLITACDAVFERVKAGHHRPLACPLCTVSHESQDALLVHFFQAHHIRTVDFADVRDLDGFLNTLTERIFHHPGGAVVTTHCPVCDKQVASAELGICAERASSLDALYAHTASAHHTVWNETTIPALTAFLIPAVDADAGDKVSGDVNEAGGENDQEGWEAVGDVDEGWEEPAKCLYCEEITSACLEHMKRVHNFDLPAATRQHVQVKDEYDVIRLINAVRRELARGRCPGCEFHGDSTECEEHLQNCPVHRLPAEVPTHDTSLIPVIPGDSLLSLVVTAGEGFLPCEEEDPDFPMVPTAHERAAAYK